VTISRESAEEALRQRDWLKAWDYWGAVWEAGGPADEWLRVMEEAVLPHAMAGDLVAQRNLGSIGISLYRSGPPEDIAPLHRALKWIVKVLRQELSATGLQMLVEGYDTLRRQGVLDPDIEAYLSEPEPRAAWLKWSGREPLP
jgi:hypothetical protein